MVDDRAGALLAMTGTFQQVKGEAVAIAATNEQVTDVNVALREAARAIGIVEGPEIVIRAVPRGNRKSRPKPVDLALSKGDRLILGGEAVIDGVTVRNASRLTVRDIIPDNGTIVLETGDGQVLATDAGELARVGKGGKPVAMQHAYCVTVHAAQGATLARTLWLASHEDSRSALVAMTRHREDLQVFIDRSALPRYGDVPVTVGRHGMTDPEDPEDSRDDMEIVAAVGRSMERPVAPRNALDVIGLEKVNELAGVQQDVMSLIELAIGRRVAPLSDTYAWAKGAEQGEVVAPAEPDETEPLPVPYG